MSIYKAHIKTYGKYNNIDKIKKIKIAILLTLYFYKNILIILI